MACLEKKMNHGSITIIFHFTFLAFLLVHANPAVAEEDREFDYVIGSDKGPDRWGELYPDWAACKYGHFQSPISLLDEKVIHKSGALDCSYRPTEATIVNNGHAITIQWEAAAGEIKVNGAKYLLKQCHWHSPSEHTINGRSYDVELHMVHESIDKKIAVVGVVYNIGLPDPFLLDMEDSIRSIAGLNGSEKAVGVIDPERIMIGQDRDYYRYMGSLTTPPCTEGVVWTIIKEVQTVSQEQVTLLREAIHNMLNARPVQPINDRPVYAYNP